MATAKYEKLGEYLRGQPAAEVPMTFAEIEGLIGQALPASARKHRPWWSNNPSNSVITKAWLDAGYKTERVDMGAERLVFRKAGRALPSLRPSAPSNPNPLAGLYGALRGTVRFRAGVDLTISVGGPWSADGSE